MKRLLAFAVLATTTASFAAERNVYDIMYLPNQGVTYGVSTLQWTKGTIEATDDTDISGWGLAQTVGHSFTDRLSLEGTLNYSSTEVDSDAVGASAYDVTGLSDLTLNARWRAVESSEYTWDVLGGAILGYQDREEDSSGDENNVQGGYGVFAGTQFGKQEQDWQWAVLGLITRNLETTAEVSGAADVEEDSHNEILLRADGLWKVQEKSFVRAFLAAQFDENDDFDFRSEASSTTYTLGTAYQYMWNQDVLLSAGVDYSMANIDSGSVDNWNTWKFNVGARYQF